MDRSTRVKFEAEYTPIVSELGDWWDQHVEYSKFSRQGIDIVCAHFEQKQHNKPKILANIIICNGFGDTFLRYAEITKSLYETGCFNIHHYDHQSQGLSGRWLQESQSIWVNSFEDYIDDFIYFATSLSSTSTSSSPLPIYVLGYCLGGLITSIVMSRLPNLIQRCILISPMLRMKCSIKYFNYKLTIPQPIARWLAMCACWAGMGTVSIILFILLLL